MSATVRALAASLHAVAIGLDDLRAHTVPLLADTRSALRRAEGANRKADALIDAAASLTTTADNAARLATKVVSNPFVKVVAFFTGVGRGVRRLFGGPTREP